MIIVTRTLFENFPRICQKREKHAFVFFMSRLVPEFPLTKYTFSINIRTTLSRYRSIDTGLKSCKYTLKPLYIYTFIRFARVDT